MKRIPQPFGRKVWGYRSSDEEIQGSVWHFPFPSVEESKTTAGRTRHRNRYIDGNKPSRPLRIAAKSAVEESGSFLEQDSTAVPNFAYRSFCPCGNLVGECLPQTLLMRLTPLEKFPQILFGLFQKQFRYTPRFSPISERTPRTESLLIKSQALFENFCEVILWHNSKTASSAGQKESRNRRNDYSFCSRLRRCAFTLP